MPISFNRASIDSIPPTQKSLIFIPRIHFWPQEKFGSIIESAPGPGKESFGMGQSWTCLGVGWGVVLAWPGPGPCARQKSKSVITDADATFPP